MLFSPQILVRRQPVVVVAGGGGNAFTLIANTSASGASGPITTAGVNTTGANLLIVAVSQYFGIGAVTLSDSKGNTWTGLTAKVGPSEAYNRIYYCAAPVVGSSHTFTYDNGGGSVNGALAVQAWSGANVSPFDLENGSTTASGSGLSAGSVTPTNDNSLIVSAVDSTTGSSGSYSVGSSFTITDNIPCVAGVEGLAFAYLKQNAKAAVNPSWSWTGTSDAAATIAVFKP